MGELYLCGSGGVLALALSLTVTREELQRICGLFCEKNNISLYRCLQRPVYYWPEIAKEVADCKGLVHNAKSPLM